MTYWFGWIKINKNLNVQSNRTWVIALTKTVREIIHSVTVCQLRSHGQLVQGVSMSCDTMQSQTIPVHN